MNLLEYDHVAFVHGLEFVDDFFFVSIEVLLMV